MKELFLAAADFLGNKVSLPAEEREVVAYGLEILCSNFLSLVLALAAGVFWGISSEILIVAVVWLLVRRFVGGAHCSTLWRCALTSSVLLLVLGGGARYLAMVLGRPALFITIMLCNFFIFTVTLLWAPADNPRRPISASNQRRYFRRKAIIAEIILVFLLWLGFFTFHLPASLLLAAALGMAAEGFTVTPRGYQVMGLIDRALGFLGGKLHQPLKGGGKG